MVAAGMTPQAALQTATINPARYLGREMTLGTIAVGKSADLVLLDGNPFEDIANVRRIRAVVSAGRFLDRAALDRLLVQAKAAALRKTLGDFPRKSRVVRFRLEQSVLIPPTS